MIDQIRRLKTDHLLHLGRLAAMTGGFLMLLLEIRFQHRAALVDDWRPWMPIIFCNSMIYLIPIAGIFWNKGGRQVSIAAYCLTITLGTIGVYFHSERHPFERLMEMMQVWLIPPDMGAQIISHHPPILAPLAFVGLGLIGLLFCFENRTNFAAIKIPSSVAAPVSIKS